MSRKVRLAWFAAAAVSVTVVLAVGIRFAFNLILAPEELYSIRPLEGGT